MTVVEFANKYYLNDSGIDKIEYNPVNHTLRMKMDFCFWWQDWYNIGETTNGKIAVTFDNVTYFEYENWCTSKVSTEIVNSIIYTEIEKAGIFILYIDEYWNDGLDEEPIEDIDNGDCRGAIMKIKADNVTVEEIERYKLPWNFKF